MLSIRLGDLVVVTSRYTAVSISVFLVFFFNDTATTEIYTLSLHDALPIFWTRNPSCIAYTIGSRFMEMPFSIALDRKSTRLNSSHANNLVCRLLLEKKKYKFNYTSSHFSSHQHLVLCLLLANLFNATSRMT